MKHLIAVFFCFVVNSSFCQVKTPVLFISNQDAKLVIDGTQDSQIKANTPTKVNLSLGDHLIQAKGEKETLTQTLSCVDSKQKVVSLNFNETNAIKIDTPPSPEQAEKSILNNSFALGGKLESTNAASKYFSFDINDKIKFSCNVSYSGTVNLQVYSYPDNQIVYGKNSFKFLVDSFIIPKKGVYYFAISNNYVFEAKPILRISRIPSPISNPNFSTNIIAKKDTTLIRVSDDSYNLTSIRMTIPVNISTDTRYWAYWLGIGNEAIIKYDTYAEFYAQGKTGNDIYPIYGYSTGKLATLPSAFSRDMVDYYFADNLNAQSFLAGNQFKYYTFKHGTGITSDFSKVDATISNSRLLISVPQTTVGQKIKIVIASFQIKESYSLDTGD